MEKNIPVVHLATFEDIERNREEKYRKKRELLRAVRIALATRLMDMITDPENLGCTIPNTLPDAILRGDALKIQLFEKYPEVEQCFLDVCFDLHVSKEDAEVLNLTIFPLWGPL